MAGLQEAAAIISVVDISFRSVCALYDFLQDLKETPQQIERLRSEVTTLKNILAALEYLQRADVGTQAIVARFDTPAALNNCAHICEILHSDFQKWTRTGRQSFRTKIQIRWHKKGILDQVSHIAVAKQTVLLSIAALQLALRVPETMDDRRQTEPMDIDEMVDQCGRRYVAGILIETYAGESTAIAPSNSALGSALGRPRYGEAHGDGNIDGSENRHNNSAPDIGQANKIHQSDWKVKLGDEGQEVVGVNQSGRGPSRDDIKQPGWDVASGNKSKATFGVKQ